MTISVKDGGTWKPVKQVFVKDGGTWKEVKQIFVKDGGTWKETYKTGSPPVIVTNGSITGSGQVNSALSYTVATFSGDPTPTVSYAWYADASQVAGQVSSYTPTELMIGKAITVQAIGTNASGSVTATSNSISITGIAPIVTGNGVISGDSKAGSTLSYTTVASFSGTPTPSVSYEWQVDGSRVAGQQSTYTTSSSDVGKQVTVLATGTNSAGSVQNRSNSITVTPAVSLVTFEFEIWGGGGCQGWNGVNLQGSESRGGYARYRVTAPENGQIRVVTGKGASVNEDKGFGYNKGGSPVFVGGGYQGASGGGGGSTGVEFRPSGGSLTWIAVAGGGGGVGKQQTNTPTGQDGYGYGGPQGSPSDGRQGNKIECQAGDPPINTMGGGGGGGASGGSGGNSSCGNPQPGQGGGGNYQSSPLNSVGGGISLLSSSQGNSKGFGGGAIFYTSTGAKKYDIGDGADNTYNISDFK